MNALCLGAFDAEGVTDWFTLLLPVITQQHRVGAVRLQGLYVTDSFLDSQVIVEKVGHLQCENYGDCTVMRESAGEVVQLLSQLRAGQFGCDTGEYPLAYREKNCIKISSNANLFSAAGEDWVWNTMHCL
ncbi:hypothetical protein ColTof4_01480 [Colletotrichum tofieldiae]|nr:hypothetical protein ColTof3_08736 [Colletotrichum tofieldiae]GKT69057.1 hypothetical protein ColTof4_01480 [Colletotrichum tofieldiae]GKT96923.1 hypothetical protein Ct61P_14773 [Colletotrichum tofieldiae]